MNEKMDMRISGSSTMPGGEYDRVSISGSGTVQGDLRCQSLSCSGSVHIVVADAKASLGAKITFAEREVSMPQAVIDALKK